LWLEEGSGPARKEEKGEGFLHLTL
jgi:hypothetical protein